MNVVLSERKNDSYGHLFGIQPHFYHAHSNVVHLGPLYGHRYRAKGLSERLRRDFYIRMGISVVKKIIEKSYINSIMKLRQNEY